MCYNIVVLLPLTNIVYLFKEQYKYINILFVRIYKSKKTKIVYLFKNILFSKRYLYIFKKKNTTLKCLLYYNVYLFNF